MIPGDLHRERMDLEELLGNAVVPAIMDLVVGAVWAT
jgi:hypothetical protein